MSMVVTCVRMMIRHILNPSSQIPSWLTAIRFFHSIPQAPKRIFWHLPIIRCRLLKNDFPDFVQFLFLAYNFNFGVTEGFQQIFHYPRMCPVRIAFAESLAV